jgi:hypothetical protein
MQIDHLRANRFWEVPIVERRGISISFNSRLVHDLINLIGSDALANSSCRYIENFPSKLHVRHINHPNRKIKLGTNILYTRYAFSLAPQN